MKYRGKCSGMEDHFDTSGVFEISKFDKSKFACYLFHDVILILSMVNVFLIAQILRFTPSR